MDRKATISELANHDGTSALERRINFAYHACAELRPSTFAYEETRLIRNDSLAEKGTFFLHALQSEILRFPGGTAAAYARAIVLVHRATVWRWIAKGDARKIAQDALEEAKAAMFDAEKSHLDAASARYAASAS